MADPPVGAPVMALKFPAGTDNRSREYALAEGAARALVNLDVTRDGGLRCRDGLRQVTTGDCHSLFAPPRGRFALLVRNGALYRLDSDESLTALLFVAGSVCYAELNDEIFWSDGSTVGRVLADGSLGNWGLATPSHPLLEAVSGYGLPAGHYSVAMTAVQTATGLESGAAEPASLMLLASSGIQVTVPAASAGFQFRLYLTPPNGESGELHHVATVDPGTTTVLATQTPDGPRLPSLLAVKPYPATRLVAYKGRLWAASGSVVWHTSERSPHWLFPMTGFTYFESAIHMLGVAEDGIYVGLADRVYYLQGTQPGDMTLRLVSRVGAVAGGGEPLPTDVFGGDGPPARQCAWWDTEGFLCIGKPGGVIIRPNGDRYSAGAATTAASGYRAHNGLRQWVSVLRAESALSGALQAVDTGR